MPIPRSRTWILLAGTIVLQIAIIRSATVLKHGLSHDGTYNPQGVYKRDPTTQTLPYSEWYNTSSTSTKPFIAFAYLLLLSFLFSFIGIVASDFFCPNLSTIATYLGLSETTAGVTFLAFGNGSPDVFSTFSAMNQGTFSLAIGELIGAATFSESPPVGINQISDIKLTIVTSVVVGSIALIRPFYVPKTAFIRDVSFFTAAVIVLVLVLRDGHLTLVESTAMVALYLLYVVVVIIMNVMAKEKRQTYSTGTPMIGKIGTPDEDGWKSLPGSGGFGTGAGGVGPISRPSSLQLPSPGFGPVGVREEDEISAGSLTPTGPNPNSRRHSNSHPHPHPHTHMHLHLGNMLNTPDYAETPRANFSLLGAIEFRDVVNSLKKEGVSRTPSPGRSPYTAVERTDYFGFTAGHRRSVSQAAVRRSSSVNTSVPSSSGPNRSRAISHVVQPGNMATFTMTPSDISPSKRKKLDRTRTAPHLGTTPPQPLARTQARHHSEDGEEEVLTSPILSDSQNPNPWKDQSGNPPSKPVLPKLSIPEPGTLNGKLQKKRHGATPSISIMDPSGHVEEPIFSPPPPEPTPIASDYQPRETRFRFRHRTRMILRVLFPSLQSFRHKSIIGMILSVFSVPAILVLTLTLPVVDDGDREGGIALPESEEEPLATSFETELENGQQLAEEEGDGLLRPDIGEGLHHLVEGGFSPLHSPLGRIHHQQTRRQSPVDSPLLSGDGEDEEMEEELMHEMEREEAFTFNKSLTAAQCIFGPTFCAYIICSRSTSLLLSK
jgi:sodium/potassium/calcium exchanger 6